MSSGILDHDSGGSVASRFHFTREMIAGPIYRKYESNATEPSTQKKLPIADPNRLYAMAGSLDPDGKNGGPVL